MALARNLQLENDTSVNTGYHTKAQSMSASGGDTIAGLNNSGTGTGKSDSAKGNSLSNISASSIKRTDNGGDDDDSSVFDSSSSDTECDDDSIKRAIDRIPGTLAPGEARVLPNANVKVAVEAIAPGVRPSPAASTIGAIAVHNSSDITFGNKTYIKGQVVIKNIYQDRKNGTTNQGYQVQENETDDTNSTKKVPSATKPPEPRTWQSSLKTIIKDKPLLSFIVMVSLMIVLCAIVAVISILTASGKARFRLPVGDGDDNRQNIPQDKDIEDDLFPDPRPLRLVTRTEWLAQPPREELTDLKLPVNNVIIAHTATEGCTTQQACKALVQSIQRYHVNHTNYGDIGYNFLIGGDEFVYEGRGWLKVGAHTKNYNTISYGIAFIGNYETINRPTEQQMEQLVLLLRNGTDGGWLAKEYKLCGASQLKGTISPGKYLMEQLRLLPHFSERLAACRLRVRLIQEFHMDGKNYDDITYNFLIGGDGHIYEGRNWHKIGATIPGYNSRSITVAFVGEYNYGGKPTKKQIELLKYLLHFGAKERHLKEGYRIYASEQLDPTVGTGKWLIEALHSLPQFVDKEQNKDEQPDHEYYSTKCMYQVKLIQEFHSSPDSRNFSDIAYQFLVGGDGNAYEGRGWTKQGAHTKGFNVDSICIAFIGTFIADPPPIAQLSAAKQLILLGMKENYLASNYSLYGHRQLAPFESPGKALFDIIKTWPHWSNKLGSNHWVEPANDTTNRR
ncbi:peptidoglycan-recognition protein LC [Anopheles gambiae]|uniref:peptidoglycan-recognition protein LC n=1 Tax=Anopheles gambiae TaxID=7165 RepID=UPI002AC9E520|nr:peptidoglycan-recognition protein LC [Anopheles gambiae]